MLANSVFFILPCLNELKLFSVSRIEKSWFPINGVHSSFHLVSLGYHSTDYFVKGSLTEKQKYYEMGSEHCVGANRNGHL